MVGGGGQGLGLGAKEVAPPHSSLEEGAWGRGGTHRVGKVQGSG